jgi:hypothetical protein
MKTRPIYGFYLFITLLMIGFFLAAPQQAHSREISVLSQTGRTRVTLRYSPQTLLPVRETQFWAELTHAQSGQPINHLVAISQRRDPNTGVNQWHDQTGAIYSNGQAVSTHLWMQMGNSGHGSAATVTTNDPVGSNRLHIENAFFTMHGRWQLIFVFYNNLFEVDRAIFDLDVARPTLY